MRGWLLLLALSWSACGDSGLDADGAVFTPHGGTRLALYWDGYTDGTRVPSSAQFYDRALHTTCAPVRWADGVERCVPVADDVVYTDGECRDPIGREVTYFRPTHFVEDAEPGGHTHPVRVLQAGAPVPPVTRFFQKIGDWCAGPRPSPDDARYRAVLAEVPASELVTLHDRDIGDGRVTLRVRESDDGAQVIREVRDRALDVRCVPTRLGADGTVACEPQGAVVAEYFGDPACLEPALFLLDVEPRPALAVAVDGAGCPTYHRLRPERLSTVYARGLDGSCVSTNLSAIALEPALALPALTREVEDVAAHRLQRLVLGEGDLRFFDDQLLDTATGATCRGSDLGDGTRCLPALATGAFASTAGCSGAFPIALVPQPACERPAFALGVVDDEFAIRAIGDPITTPLFVGAGPSQCTPWAAPSGDVPYGVGPPIDPSTFVGATLFGER